MPITFFKDKQYVVISHEIRVPYYRKLVRDFSLSLDVLTLKQLKDLFASKKVSKERFTNKDIIISGYYHEGNEIALLLNSLSGNMSIGYELEGNKENALEFYPTYLDEIKECRKKMANARKPYFLDISAREIITFCDVHTIKEFVAPLDGELFIIGFNERKQTPKEIEDIKRLIKSLNVAFLSTNNKDYLRD